MRFLVAIRAGTDDPRVAARIWRPSTVCRTDALLLNVVTGGDLVELLATKDCT